MTTQIKPITDVPAAAPQMLPSRLHHAASVSADPERTRHFYEDIIGLPLVACWIEREEVAGELHEFSHAFYGLGDGSALAFFHFADPKLADRYAARKQEFFVHLALKMEAAARDALRQRLVDAGIAFLEMDHGFCHSIYVSDPDGQHIEFTVDVEDIDAIEARQRRVAAAMFERWLSGDRTPTNDLRP